MSSTSDCSNIENEKFHFVFVHGAGHGAWCWYKVRTKLESLGHTVTCIDLLCSGIERSDFNTVLEFDHYNAPLTDFMASLPPKQKVIVVGHSVGGSNVTAVINKFAEKIHLGVYVAAFMLKPVFMSNSLDLGSPDMYELIYGLGPDKLPTGIMVKPELRRSGLYNLSPIEDYTLATMLLRPAPAWALITILLKEGPGAKNVPRVFIKTLKDHMMTQDVQDIMISCWPPSRVFEIESDHSPFFSNPDTLVHILLQSASEFIA